MEETSVIGAPVRASHAAIESPPADSIQRHVPEQTAPVAARPRIVQVESIAVPSEHHSVSVEPIETRMIAAERRDQQLPQDSQSERIVFQSPPPASSDPSPEPSTSRESHEVREMHETIREQRTFVDRTVFEQIARQSESRKRDRALHASASQAEPEIHVSIGRIEVRAAAGAAAASKPGRDAAPVMGLDEYLQNKIKGTGR